MDARGPIEATRAIISAWRDADIHVLADLLHEDVCVSGYLADGRPVLGKAAVLEMVEGFSASTGRLRLLDVEELGPTCALLQMRIDPEPPEPGLGPAESWWMWAFDAGTLRESHAFASRDAALLWFRERESGPPG
jgi:hypothetical protein